MTERGYRERDQQVVIDELLERVHQLEDENRALADQNRALADDNRALREPKPLPGPGPNWGLLGRLLLQCLTVVLALLVLASFVDGTPFFGALWVSLLIVAGIGLWVTSKRRGDR